MNETLLKIQQELKAPKGQRNTFGNYNYRSAEDILEAVKPIAHKLKCTVYLSDEAVYIGEWNYIKATATLQVGEDRLWVTAYARETEVKKGMDASQITGSASSYARKYALNGLFAIDDTKDADTNEQRNYVDRNPQGGLDEAKAEVFKAFKDQGIDDTTAMMEVIDKAINKASIRTVEDGQKVLEYLKEQK
jgi:hypothetical protein